MWSRQLGLFLALVVVATPVLAVDTRDIGGGGGGWFRDECHAGDVLVGINTLAGKDLNTVGAVCRPMIDGRIVDQPYGLQTWGRRPADDDTGTSPGQPWCYGDNGVFSITATTSSGNTIHSFQLGCRDVVTGAESDSILSATHGGKGSNSETVGCEPGLIATGLKGRSGSLIDALGLVCSPYQSAQAQQPQQGQAAPAPTGPPQKPIKTTGKGGKNTAPTQNNGPNLKPTENGAGGNGDAGNDNGGAANGDQAARAAVDTTIYDQPGGNDVAYLSAGDGVTIVSCNDDDWCKISAPQIGWVWGEDLNR